MPYHDREKLKAARKRCYDKKMSDPVRREEANRRKREYNAAHPDRIRKTNLKKAYGIDPSIVPKNCQVCDSDGGARGIFVDHCHNSKRIRGFLCMACNCAIGQAKNSVERLEKLIKYLKEFNNEVQTP